MSVPDSRNELLCAALQLALTEYAQDTSQGDTDEAERILDETAREHARALDIA